MRDVARIRNSSGRAALLMGGVSVATLLMGTPVQAQFVCSGYTNGLAVPPPLLLRALDATAAAPEQPLPAGGREFGDGGALAWDYGSTACGLNAVAGSAGSTAVGGNAQAQAQDSTSVGSNAYVGGSSGRSTAVGSNAYAGPLSYGQGGEGNAYSTAVGAYAASGIMSTAVGADAYAFQDSAAFGRNASARGERSVAVGADASAAGEGSVAVGHGASDGGLPGQVAVGNLARIAPTGPDGETPLPGLNVALGQGSVAARGSQAYYAAYGYGRPADSIGEVSVGTPEGNRQITGVAPGSAGNDAVNVDQLRGAIDNAGLGGGGPIAGENALGAAFPLATGRSATAAGYGATASAENSVALGAGSVADRAGSVSFGSAGKERALTNVAAGTRATDAVNLGQLSSLSGEVDAVATRVATLETRTAPPLPPVTPGRTYPVASNAGAGAADPVAAGRNALAVGHGASAPAENAVAVGTGSVADQANTVSFGSVGNARRLANVAAGVDDADAVNVAQMRSAIASLPEAAYVPVSAGNASNLARPASAGADALAVGYGAKAGGAAAVALGRSSASGARSAALGDGASASGEAGVALGSLSSASGPSSAAVGAGASAVGSRSAALGAGASATGENATALGAGARASRANQVAVGTASSTYTLGGIASAGSRAQQSGPAYFATTDAQGNLAATTFDTGRIDAMDTRITGVDRRVSGVEGRVAGVEDRLGNVEGRVTGVERNIGLLRNDVRRATEGVSIAMAMAGVQLPPNKNYALSANWGNFMGENGFAATAAARVTDSTFVHAGFGVGASGGTVGGRAGITLGW